MTKRGLPGPEGSREGRGAEEGHIPWLQSTWPSPGRGRHGEATQAHFPSALRFLGTSIVSGWVRLLCVETTGFGHRQRRLVGAGAPWGQGPLSQALGDKDSACCLQRLSQLSKWNICIGFSREDEILRRTNSRKRHEWKGERRYEKTQYRLNPTSLFPPK